MDAPKAVSFAEKGIDSEICDGTIRISINDDDPTSLDHGYSDAATYGFTESIRAQSLNRLDGMLQGNDVNNSNTYFIYKCPSFPGLDRDISASSRALSTTQLETDSISPRVSTTTISQDLEAERLHFPYFTLNDVGPHARSLSAHLSKNRILPQSHANDQGSFDTASSGTTLTPRKGVKVCRSTSCPTVEYARRAVAGPGGVIFYRKIGAEQSPRQPKSAQNSNPSGNKGDVDLAGEEVKDLPFAPWNTYPDFIPEQMSDELYCSSEAGAVVPGCASVGLQRHTQQSPCVPITTTAVKTMASRTASSVPLRYSMTSFHRPNDVIASSSNRPRSVLTSSALQHNDRELITVGGDEEFVICGAGARDPVNQTNYDHPYHEQRAPHLVQMKCLRWLNSLDNDG